MHASVRALLTEIIDYAGLFPPAKLELDPAIRNYARYRMQPESWMLGRFICPTARLHALMPYGEKLFTQHAPLRLSVLGRGGETAPAFFDGLAADIDAIDSFRRESSEWARLEAFEIRLPAALCREADRKAAVDFLIDIEQAFARSNSELVLPDFYELGPTQNWREALQAIVTAFADYCRGGGRALPMPAGIKLRCGGADAAAVPTVEQATTYIEACRDHQLPLKFTAGLHQAYRRFDPGMRANVHGFVNLFVAGVLAYALPLAHHDIRAIVEETDPRHFHFGENFLGWNEADASADEVRFARSHRVIAFGSCSFEEPREDLRAVGVIS
ncbi:MAG: hypothetical protein HRF50_16765 [Phycisphaerae bacterium]|jgi:hypothetical protein